MQVNIQTQEGVRATTCYGTVEIFFNAQAVLFCFTDAIGQDRLELTEYTTGMRFPVELGEPSGETLGLDSPMRDDEPYRVELVAKAKRLVAEMMNERGLTSIRILELLQMNQRKYQTNEIDF